MFNSCPCVYVHTYTHTHTSKYVCDHRDIHTHLLAFTRACPTLHVHVYIHMHVPKHTYLFILLGMLMNMHACAYSSLPY